MLTDFQNSFTSGHTEIFPTTSKVKHSESNFTAQSRINISHEHLTTLAN